MINHNLETKTSRVFCDRCGIELTEHLYSLSTGEALCDECFKKSYEEKNVEEYIKENVTD